MTRAWRGVVADFERTATPRGRAALGYYSVEGLRLFERALRAGVRIERAVASERALESTDPRRQRLFRDLGQAGCEVTAVPEEALQALTEGRKTGDIVGLIALPDAGALAQLRPTEGRQVLLVAVDVEDPGNVGALIRTALAGFAAGFVAVGISDPYHPKALRTSMGSVFKLPVFSRPSLPPLLKELRGLGFVTVGAVSTQGEPAARADLKHPSLAVLMGSEAFGLSQEVVDGLEARVTIPMHEGVDSFSVNAAAAILLYEVFRGN